MSRFISFNNIIVWKDNQRITINIQSGTVLGADAVNMSVALHGNAGSFIIHHGLVRTPDGDGAIGADASGDGLDDKIRVIIGVVLEIIAFESVDGCTV